MRVLLDEGVSDQLAIKLAGQDVAHVRDKGWQGLKNGELLRSARGAGFDVFVTVDKRLQYQQNVTASGLSIIVMDIHPTSADNQLACADSILSLLTDVKPGSVYLVDGPHPRRGG